MKITKIIAAVIYFSAFSVSVLFAQNNMEDVNISPFWNFYSDNYLSTVAAGRGYTGIGFTGDISGSALNPASLDVMNKFQFQTQYTYKTNQPWLPELGLNNLKLMQNIYSVSVGFGWKVSKHFQAAFVYSNPSTYRIDYGQIIATNEFGNEIGSYEGYDQITVHSFSIPVMFAFGNFRFGAAINYLMYRKYFNMYSGGITGTTNRFNAQLGFMYVPTEQFSIGLTFTPPSRGHVSIDFPGDQGNKASLPLKFGAGVSYLFKGNKVRLLADYTFTGASIREEFKDQHQVHLGVEYLAKKNLSLRAGFFNYPDPRNFNTANYLNPQDDYNQIFATLGGSLSLGNLIINLAILDSHMSSGTIKNTYINGGVIYNLK
jgi:long-subunit fatty acid transport protein